MRPYAGTYLRVDGDLLKGNGFLHACQMEKISGCAVGNGVGEAV